MKHDDPLVQRALRAYFRRDDFPAISRQPSTVACDSRVLGGRIYAVLSNSSRTLAVYELRGNGLRYVSAWPEALDSR
jgi:hypothetical protein